MLAVGRDDRVLGAERRHHPGGDRLLADVQVQEAADLRGAVELGARLLEAADQQHGAQQVASARRRSRPAGRSLALGAHAVPPGSTGRPRAARARGPSAGGASPCRCGCGAGAGRRRSPWAPARRAGGGRRPSSSRRSSSVGSKPGLSVTNALTTSPATGSGLPITPASTTAGCSMSALSTSNGPDQVPGGLDHVVGATDEPDVAVGVDAGQVAAEVPAVGEALRGSAPRRRGSRGTSTASRAAAPARRSRRGRRPGDLPVGDGRPGRRRRAPGPPPRSPASGGPSSRAAPPCRGSC